MAVWICEEILRSISTVSIWYRPQSDIRVKTYCNLNLPKASLSNFERRGICWVSLKHPCQKLHRFHYAPTFLFNFERLDILWASIGNLSQRYCSLDLPVDFVFNSERLDILWTAIKYQVRSYGHLHLLGASMFNFGHLNILWDSNRHLSQMLCYFEFFRRFYVQFREFQYVMGRNWISKSEVMAI